MSLWTPAEIATRLWLDAEDSATITLNGSTVSAWGDKSGNGVSVTQTTASQQPTYAASSLNGLHTVNFDGAGDRMITNLMANFSQELTVAIVYVPDASQTTLGMLFSCS